jgi:hypothetical protein
MHGWKPDKEVVGLVLRGITKDKVKKMKEDPRGHGLFVRVVKKCTWCNKKCDQDFVIKKDAGYNKHYFHKECWVKHINWLKDLE